MKKIVVAMLFLMVGILLGQIQTARALQRSYEWDIPSGLGGYNVYQISLTTSDSWQVDTTVDITFRLTLSSKSNALDYTETAKVRITLTIGNFVLDSGDQTEVKTLVNNGDYWEKNVTFYIPTDKVSRGQTQSVAVTYLVTINEVDTIQHSLWEHDTGNSSDPMYVSLFRPILSTLEIILIIVAVIVVGGISGFLIYRRMFYKRRAKAVKPPSPPT